MPENYKGCKFCNSFPNGLWNFVQSYLKATDINSFQINMLTNIIVI